MNSFVVQITYVFKFVDFIILSGRLISQIIAKNDIISIVHPENASKQWYMRYSQNVTEDNQSHVNASRDSLARQFDCRLREWFLKVLSDTLQTSVYCLRVVFFISWWNSLRADDN